MKMRRRGLRIALQIGLLIIAIVIFVLVNEQINQEKKCSFVPKEDSNKYAYQIENVNIEDNYLVIRGWFFELQKVRNTKMTIEENDELGILLYDINSVAETIQNKNDTKKKGAYLSITKSLRQDVNDYFDCEYDYSNCGFIAKISVEKGKTR